MTKGTLMFSAGLEVDINQFMRVRGRAVIFGFFTFLLPQLMGMGLGYILGLEPLGMVLLGSAFASHTLIAFPILTRLGVTRNEAVLAAVYLAAGRHSVAPSRKLASGAQNAAAISTTNVRAIDEYRLMSHERGTSRSASARA